MSGVRQLRGHGPGPHGSPDLGGLADRTEGAGAENDVDREFERREIGGGPQFAQDVEVVQGHAVADSSVTLVNCCATPVTAVPDWPDRPMDCPD